MLLLPLHLVYGFIIIIKLPSVSWRFRFSSLLAFLVYNFSPANIFMGDTGLVSG